MAPEVLTLVPSTSPILRESAKPVTDISSEVIPHVAAMRSPMKEKSGAGLAAPQVGLSFRFFVGKIKGHSLIINPTIIKTFGNRISKSEGCLIWPGRSTYVARFDGIHTEWMNENGEIRHTTLKGMDARIFQHEMDHLNGICIF